MKKMSDIWKKRLKADCQTNFISTSGGILGAESQLPMHMAGNIGSGKAALTGFYLAKHFSETLLRECC
jgi:hypothetical protein